jgi:hypothetical protein
MTGNALTIVKTEFAMPAILEAAGPRARKRVLEFFGASIRNANTRQVYMKACTAFCDFLEDNVAAIEDIEPLQVAAYLEAMQAAQRSAAIGVTVGDVYRQKKRLWVRLHEKGGKVHDMPCRHTLEEYLDAYLEAAKLGDRPGVPLFQSFKRRPYGRGEPELSGRALSRVEAWQMVQRRGRDRHSYMQPHVSRNRDHGLSRERRYARERAAHGCARLDTHDAALRSPAR